MSGESESTKSDPGRAQTPAGPPLSLSDGLIDLASELEKSLMLQGDEFLRGRGRKGIALMKACRASGMELVRAALSLRVRTRPQTGPTSEDLERALLAEFAAEAATGLAEAETRFPWWLAGSLAGGMITEVEDPSAGGIAPSWVVVGANSAFPLSATIARKEISALPRALFEQSAKVIETVLLLVGDRDPELRQDLLKPLSRLQGAFGRRRAAGKNAGGKEVLQREENEEEK